MVRPPPWSILKRSCRGANRLLSLRSLATSRPSITWHVTTVGFVDCFVTAWRWFAEVLPILKSEELLARFGIAEDQLRLFRYRGYGNPGPTRIETEDGRAYEVSYQQLWEDESKWMIQPRCKIWP